MATKKLTLDVKEMQDDFFEDSALIGIASGMPGFRLCWLLNQSFGVSFSRQPDMDICVKRKRIDWDGEEEIEQYYPVYQYNMPLNGTRYLLYKLKVERDTLLPEVRNMDYLWMIQGGHAEADATQLATCLRHLPEIQMAQTLTPCQLKHRDNLLV